MKSVGSENETFRQRRIQPATHWSKNQANQTSFEKVTVFQAYNMGVRAHTPSLPYNRLMQTPKGVVESLKHRGNVSWVSGPTFMPVRCYAHAKCGL